VTNLEYMNPWGTFQNQTMASINWHAFHSTGHQHFLNIYFWKLVIL
jgi:hypothetical protein